MPHRLLLQSISKHVSLSEKEEKQLVHMLKYKKVKKKQLLYQEGDVHQYLVFVTEGCLRSYSVDESGLDHILQFAPPGWWISDMQSVIAGKPATLNIDAVDDSELILIKKTDLDTLFNSIPALERYFRILGERSLATYQQRLLDALSLPAVKRYNNFCQRYPSLIQCLPQKHVASYIGVTPEFLSKMLKGTMPRR